MTKLNSSIAYGNHQGSAVVCHVLQFNNKILQYFATYSRLNEVDLCPQFKKSGVRSCFHVRFHQLEDSKAEYQL